MRPEKELLKNEISQKFNRFDSFVIMKYANLTANTANEFRREVGKFGGDIEVVRKRILQKVVDEVGLNIDVISLDGHLGVIFFEQDPLTATKMVFKFGQDRDKAIQVLAGRFDGQLYQAADVEYLSTLPGKDEMRAQFLGLLEALPSQTLAVIEALLTSVPHCLENKSNLEAGE